MGFKEIQKSDESSKILEATTMRLKLQDVLRNEDEKACSFNKKFFRENEMKINRELDYYQWCHVTSFISQIVYIVMQLFGE